jgi:glutamate 5-kinase
VRIFSADQVELARGLTRYSTAELQRIAGQRSDAIEELLGYTHGDEVIHRDDMVVL